MIWLVTDVHIPSSNGPISRGWWWLEKSDVDIVTRLETDKFKASPGVPACLLLPGLSSLSTATLQPYWPAVRHRVRRPPSSPQ